MINPNKITPEIADAAEDMVDKLSISFDEAYLKLGLRHEEPPRATLLRKVLSSYDAARESQSLARRGSRDPEVRDAGGVTVCAAKARASDLTARRVFFEMYGAPTELAENAGASELDLYDAAVGHWGVFRTGVLENSERRGQLNSELSNTIQEEPGINRILDEYAGGSR